LLRDVCVNWSLELSSCLELYTFEYSKSWARPGRFLRSNWLNCRESRLKNWFILSLLLGTDWLLLKNIVGWLSFFRNLRFWSTWKLGKVIKCGKRCVSRLLYSTSLCWRGTSSWRTGRRSTGRLRSRRRRGCSWSWTGFQLI
jgi:hypothetical protein